MITKFKKIEPKISNDLKIIVKNTGRKLAGFDFRLKSKESLARKILLDSREMGISEKDAANNIKDILRYTIIHNDNTFTDLYFDAVSNLKEKGYDEIRIKNIFKDGAPYKGVNTLLKDINGNIFELQYHTPKSYEIKEGRLHELYEKRRTLDKIKDLEEYNRLKKEMIKLSKQIANPINVDKIR